MKNQQRRWIGLFPLCAIVAIAGMAGAATTQPSSFGQTAEQGLEAQIIQTRKRVEHDENQVADARNRVNAIEEQLRQKTGRTEVAPPILHAAAAALDDQIEALELQAVSDSARHDAIVEAIKQISDRSSADSDPVVASRLNVVQARKDELDTVRKHYAAGFTNAEDVTKVEAELASAQADLEVQRENVLAAKGGDAVVSLNKELIDVQIAQADNDAELKFLRDRRDALASGFPDLDSLESAQSQEQQAETELERSREDLHAVEMNP